MSKPWILIKKLLKLVEKSIDRFILTADLKFQVMVGNGLPVTVQGNETEELLVAVMLVPIVEMFGGPETTKEIVMDHNQLEKGPNPLFKHFSHFRHFYPFCFSNTFEITFCCF